jgi:hypothetical protein
VTLQSCEIEPFVAQSTPQSGSPEEAASAGELFQQQVENYLNRLRAAICEDVTKLGRGELDQIVFDDYIVSGLEVRLGANAPTLRVFRDGLELLAFAGTGQQADEAFFTIHLLHGLRPGSSPTFHIHWAHIIGAPTGDVKWNIEFSVARGYEAGTFPASTTLSTVQTAAAQFVHHITNDDDMVVVNSVEIEPDAVLICRVFRDPGDGEDTFANDAYLVQVDMHYERTFLGTLERNRPWTSTGY